MTTTTPSDTRALRVDLVGSFLRPQSLMAAWERYGAGTLDEAGLAAEADRAIRKLIATEVAHGLPILTDGEFRRENFQQSFADVAGFSGKRAWISTQRGDEEPAAGFTPNLFTRQTVTQRLALERNRPLEEFRFAQSLSDRPVKVTLIGPDRIAQQFDEASSRAIYADETAFVEDVVRVQREIIAQLRDAGCRYVQIDEPSYTAYVDPTSLTDMRARGANPMALLDRSIAADNALVRAFPELTFGVHLCRGNRRSHWHREGSYDAIAERLFTGLQHDRLLLEYDTERAGSFEPLRFVPKGKTAVLGLITTKEGALEDADALLRRIDEAARFCPIEQLAISPQCGFASSLPGNALTPDEQWRKIDRMLEVATRVWG